MISRVSVLLGTFALSSWAAIAAADGVVILDGGVSDPDHLTNHPRVAADGRIFLQIDSSENNCARRVVGTDSQGTLLATFGQAGTLAVMGVCDLDPTSTNSFHVMSVGNLEQRDSAFVTTWASPFYYETQSHTSTGGGRNMVFIHQPDGKWAVGGSFIFSANGLVATDWALTRINADGTMDSSFAGGGVVRQQFDASGTGLDRGAQLVSIHALAGGQLLASGRVETNHTTRTWQTNLSRYNSNGTLDFSFGVNGELRLPDSLGASVLDGGGRVYLVGANGHVTRLATDYSVDGAYAGGAVDAQLHIADLDIDSAGRVVIFGTIDGVGGPHVYVARFDTSGNADATFNGTGVINFTPPRPLATGCRGTLHSGDRPLVACPVLDQADPGGTPAVDVMLARFTTTGVLDASFGATQADTDQYPDAFSFADVIAAFGAANVAAAPVTVTGINTPTIVRTNASAGTWSVSVGCTGDWNSTGGQVTPGQTLCVRMDAPTASGGTNVLTVDVGGRVATYSVHASATPADLVPDAFAFTAQSNVARNTQFTSNTVTVQGITGSSPVLVSNGAYSRGCSGVFTTTPGTITNGEMICVRHTSSAAFSGTMTTTIAIGGMQGSFATTTLAADTAPDAFAFVNGTNVAPGSVVASNAVTISGTNTDADITITGGEYSLGCIGVFTAAAGTIAPGQSVCVRHTASAANGTTTRTTLTIGGVSDEFSSTTIAAGSGSPHPGGGGAFDGLSVLVLLSALGYGFRRRRSTRHQSTSP
jgi:uncharacterized delta-60 repeat protein